MLLLRVEITERVRNCRDNIALRAKPSTIWQVTSLSSGNDFTVYVTTKSEWVDVFQALSRFNCSSVNLRVIKICSYAWFLPLQRYLVFSLQSVCQQGCAKKKTTNLKLWGIKLCSQADEISTVSLTHFVSVPLDVLNLTTCAMETMPVESQLAALLWRRH